MSKLVIQVPHAYNIRTAWGYYRTSKRQDWKILEYVDTPEWTINGFVVFAFSSMAGEWWIGVDAMFERHKMDIIGPYDSASEAVVMIKLLGTPRK